MTVLKRDTLKQLFAGGVAGCCAKIVIAPLDRTKILLQLQHPYYRKYGVFQCMYEICKKEGVLSLWKGTTMMMIRVFPYSSIEFFTFDKTVTYLDRTYGEHRKNYFIAGATGGTCGVLVTYPLDLMRARLAYQITGEGRYKGIFDAFRTIFRTEGGIRAFYQGITPTLVGVIPYGGISFYTFNNMKDFLLRYFPLAAGRPSLNANDAQVLKVWVSILTGGFAGAVSQTASYPMDVARRRMQLSNELDNPKVYKRVWSTLLHVYREDGVVKGLYRGLSINYIRVIPQQAIAYTVYEQLRQYLGINKKHK